MILREVKRSLQAQQRMTLSQIAAEVGSDRTAVASALEYFVARGDVYREIDGSDGATCGVPCRNCPLGDFCIPGVHRGSAAGGLEVFVWNQKENSYV